MDLHLFLAGFLKYFYNQYFFNGFRERLQMKSPQFKENGILSSLSAGENDDIIPQ